MTHCGHKFQLRRKTLDLRKNFSDCSLNLCSGLRRSCLMSLSSEADPKGDQGSAWVEPPWGCLETLAWCASLDLSVWGAAAGAGSQHLSHLCLPVRRAGLLPSADGPGTARSGNEGAAGGRSRNSSESDSSIRRPETVASNRAPLPGLGREARRRVAPLVLAAGAQAAARWTARVVTST
jgi:hypothetical protein